MLSSSSLVMVDYDDNNLKEKKEDGGPEGLRSPDLRSGYNYYDSIR